MNTPQFQQLKHRINHGQTPDVSGETFTAEQVDSLRYYLRFKPEYLATIVAQQEKAEVEENTDEARPELLEDAITVPDSEDVVDKETEVQPTKKTKTTKR